MRKRDNLLKKARSTGDKRSPAWLEYRCQRNKVVKLLKTAHNDYRKNVIGGSLEEKSQTILELYQALAVYELWHTVTSRANQPLSHDVERFHSGV